MSAGGGPSGTGAIASPGDGPGGMRVIASSEFGGRERSVDTVSPYRGMSLGIVREGQGRGAGPGQKRSDVYPSTVASDVPSAANSTGPVCPDRVARVCPVAT